MDAAHSHSHAQPGTQWLGEFEIVAPIKRGGMATLYRARRYGAAGFTRELALKVLNNELAGDERYLTMFVDEARISSRLSHPNVVRVEEFGNERGVHFLAMEYIDGCSINDLLKMVRRSGRVLAPDAAIHIAMKVCEGLHAAHETLDESGRPLELIHRDISPSNILLARNGHVKLIDFGIAKAHGRLGATRTGNSLKGKLRYMAPEQAIGDELDRRADIYSLGVVLWELLAGRQLFSANTEVELFERITNPVVAAPSTFSPDVTPALDQLVLSMLSLRPEHRPPSADHVRHHLREVAPGALRCDSQSIARLVDAALESTVRVPEVHTPVSFDRAVALNQNVALPPSQPSPAEVLPPSRARFAAVLLVAAVSLTAAAVVAGLWISAAIAPAAAPFEDGTSLSGDKTVGHRSHEPRLTTPEGEAVIDKRAPVVAPLVEPASKHAPVFEAAAPSSAKVVSPKRANARPSVQSSSAKKRPATKRSGPRMASDFEDDATAAPKAKVERMGRRAVPLATDFD